MPVENVITERDSNPGKPVKDDHAGQIAGAEIKKIRETMRMTQEQFSKKFDVPVGTLRRWEQGQNNPSSVACILSLLKRSSRVAKQGIIKDAKDAAAEFGNHIEAVGRLMPDPRFRDRLCKLIAEFDDGPKA